MVDLGGVWGSGGELCEVEEGGWVDVDVDVDVDDSFDS